MANVPQRVDALFLGFQSAVAGRYSLDRELGRGGMGIVYLAREVQLDRPVAIKLLPPERAMDDALRERFVREARMAAKLSHPNIIPIIAVDEADGFVFYVMAYVDGETLGERVRSRGPMSASDATRVLREVAWALGHAHAQGVVHRDVKPENIMLERSSGRALVTDFGIAAALGAEESPAVAGTPEYMSPEQALGGELDARSDVYGLGATAYFLVAGRPPFAGARAVDVVAKQVALPAPPLSSIGVTVPRRLAHLVEKCLAKDPNERPGSANALAEQLGAAVESRREVPAPLRAFVKRDARLVGPGAIVAGYFAMMGTVALSIEAGAVTAVTVVGATLFGLPFAAMVASARKLLRRGFTLADVGGAFDHEIETLKEEFQSEGRVERRKLEQVAMAVSVGGAGVMLTGMVISTTAVVTQTIPPGDIGRIIGLSGLTAFIGLVTLTVLRRRRPHSAPEGWRKFWLGSFGRAAFAVAKRLGGRPIAGAATTHRATEMAIGMAADELFRSLPKETRRAIGDVPAVVTALQRDATSLRSALDKLNDSLADSGEAGSSDAYADMRTLRDQVAERHRQVITALETTRLNLLRLHAGAMQVDGFTTDFDRAGEVSVEVRRLLEARGELDAYLRFPSPPRQTPA